MEIKLNEFEYLDRPHIVVRHDEEYTLVVEIETVGGSVMVAVTPQGPAYAYFKENEEDELVEEEEVDPITEMIEEDIDPWEDEDD